MLTFLSCILLFSCENPAEPTNQISKKKKTSSFKNEEYSIPEINIESLYKKTGDEIMVVRVSTTKLNLRENPSTDGEIVGEFFKGHRVKVLQKDLGEDRNWYKVKSMDDLKIGYVHSDFLISIDAAKRYHELLLKEYFPIEVGTTYTYHFDPASQDNVELNFCDVVVTHSEKVNIQNTESVIYHLNSRCERLLNHMLEFYLNDGYGRTRDIVEVNSYVIKNNEVYLAHHSNDATILLALIFSPSDRYLAFNWVVDTEVDVKFYKSKKRESKFLTFSEYEPLKNAFSKEGSVRRKKAVDYATYNYKKNTELGHHGEVIFEKGIGLYSMSSGGGAGSEIILMKKSSGYDEESFYRLNEYRDSPSSTQQRQSQSVTSNNRYSNNSSRNTYTDADEELGKWLCSNTFVRREYGANSIMQFEPIDRGLNKNGIVSIKENGCGYVFNYEVDGSYLKTKFFKSTCGKELTDIKYRISKYNGTVRAMNTGVMQVVYHIVE